MKRLRIFIIPAVVLSVFGIWWFSPTQVLKRRTLSLLETLTLEETRGRAGLQLGAYSLNSLLAKEVELETPTLAEANGQFDRTEMEAAYGWLCSQAKKSHFTLKEFRSITIDGDLGQVDLTVDALVELLMVRPADGNYVVEFRWQKSEEGWRLSRAKWDLDR